MTFRNSTTEPGQPWVITIGKASGSGERTWTRWMASPSIVVRNCSNPLSRCSRARQSYWSAQYRQTSRM
jgi:hypothetical protein